MRQLGLNKFPQSLFLGTVLLCSAHCAWDKPFTKSSVAPLQGTFLQLLAVHQGWEKEDWEQLFSYFRQLWVSRLVVQWTVFDKIEFFADDNSPANDPAPLNFILQEADKAGMEVFVGLVLDSSYWSEISKDPQSVRNYLTTNASVAKTLANRLTPILKNHSSFQGWYITAEIDDSSWKTEDSQRILFDYLNDLSAHLHALFPDKRVALSGFCNAEMSPASFELFWDSLLKAAPIDIVLFQDGIGANKLSFSQLPVYLAAIHQAVEANARQLQVIVELFEQLMGEKNPHHQFSAKAAGLKRVQKQIQFDDAYGSDLVAFSIPEYMTPLGGPQAKKLFEGYLKIWHP